MKRATELAREIASTKAEIKKHDKLYHCDCSPIISDYEYDALKLKLHKMQMELISLQNSNVNCILDESADVIDDMTIGFAPDRRFTKISHNHPMLSLSNALDSDDMYNYFIKIQSNIDQLYASNIAKSRDVVLACEPKIDGVSFSTVYKDGELSYAATRGNGTVGEDVTKNVLTICDLPHTISYYDYLEIRGEIYIEKDDFLALNSQRCNAGEAAFVNPRNAAAGSLRQLDANITRSRKLKYYVWGGYLNDSVECTSTITSHSAMLSFFASLGFRVNQDVVMAKTFQDIQKYYTYMESARQRLPYDIDGIVCKVDDMRLYNEFGCTSSAPRWAIAYKFPGKVATTTINNIKIQISKSGILTPVAELAPVNIGGVMITRATLHNADEIAKLDIRIGDTVLIERAGDVIPKIKAVDYSKRLVNSHTYVFPTHCPACGSLIVQINGEAARKCSGGALCVESSVAKLAHFTSKNAFNIIGLGKQQLRQLYDWGFVRQPSDIFAFAQQRSQLNIQNNPNALNNSNDNIGVNDNCGGELILSFDSVDSLQRKSGWDSKSVHNLVTSINKARNISFANFLFSLNIKYVGMEVAEIIASHYRDANKLLTIMNDISDETKSVIHKDICTIDGIGEKTATSIIQYMTKPENVDEIKRLLEYVNILPQNGVNNNDGDGDVLKAYGDSVDKITKADEIKKNDEVKKTVVFTGTLARCTRAKAKSIANAVGINVVSAISKTVDYLIVGGDKNDDISVKKKINDAKKIGTKIMYEDEFWNMINLLERNL